jgi:Cu2+-containing amine oxidase
MTERPLGSEQNAIRDVDFSANRNWRVANTHTTNALGQFTGYTLVPVSATPIFALAGSAPRRTVALRSISSGRRRMRPKELYAGGEFQNLGRDWEGLSTFAKADRALADTDVVPGVRWGSRTFRGRRIGRTCRRIVAASDSCRHRFCTESDLDVPK